MTADPLRRGLALFNDGRFFEAHEALEDAWRATPSQSDRRRHLQGLVQLAVAFHHASRQNYAGARSVLSRGLRNLRGAEPSFPNITFAELHPALQEWLKFLHDAEDVAPNRTNSMPPPLPKLLSRTASRG